jgi:poly(beta-D-mannuronate) lyase
MPGSGEAMRGEIDMKYLSTTAAALVSTFAVSATLACGAVHAQEALRSPWDASPERPTPGGYSCPKPGALPRDIEASSFYSDSKHSVIDQKKYDAYNTARKQYEDVTREVARAADKYQQNGNREAAECVLNLLDDQARNSAMTGSMSSNQAYYVQNWTLGALAIDWLKVRSADPGTPEQRQAAIDWMKQVAGQTRAYFTERHAKGTNDGTNNHYYWAGLAVMAAAVSGNDRASYDWAKGTFEEAASRVAPDGTLPLEMARGQRALHYHIFAITPMVMLAEFGEANGDDLYAAHGHAVEKLATRIVAGLLNNSYFTEKAGVQQDTPGKEGLKSGDVAWMVPYLKRFPDANANKLLQSVEVAPYNYLGGYPPGWKK